MSKNQMWTIAITAIVVLMIAPRLKALPGLNKLPSV
jgi:hypothetical protein